MSFDQQSGDGQWVQNPDGTWLTPNGKTAWQNADGSWQTTDGWYLGASGQWQYIGAADSSAQQSYGQQAYGQQGGFQQESAQQDFNNQTVAQPQADQLSNVSDQAPAVEEPVIEPAVANASGVAVPEVEHTVEVNVPPPSDEVVSDAPGIPTAETTDSKTAGPGEQNEPGQADAVVTDEPLQTEPVQPGAVSSVESDTVVYQQASTQPAQEASQQYGLGSGQFATTGPQYYSAADSQATWVMPAAQPVPDYSQASVASPNAAAAASSNAYSQSMPGAYAPQNSNMYNAYEPYEDYDAYNDDEEKKGKGGMIAIILLIITLVALIAAGVYLYFWVLNDDSDQADGKQIVKEQPADKDKKNKDDTDDQKEPDDKDAQKDKKEQKDNKEQKDPINNENPDVKFPAPSDALSIRSFVMPSGNIECQIVSTEVGCAIVERQYEAKGLKDCKGKEVFNLHLDRSGVEIECDIDYRDGGAELPYGETTAYGEHACESNESGVRCWNVYSGKEFRMAREAWSAN